MFVPLCFKLPCLITFKLKTLRYLTLPDRTVPYLTKPYLTLLIVNLDFIINFKNFKVKLFLNNLKIKCK